MRYEVMTELLNRLDSEKRIRTRACCISLAIGFALGGVFVWVMI